MISYEYAFFFLYRLNTEHVWSKQACYHTRRVPSPYRPFRSTGNVYPKAFGWGFWSHIAPSRVSHYDVVGALYICASVASSAKPHRDRDCKFNIIICKNYYLFMFFNEILNENQTTEILFARK